MNLEKQLRRDSIRLRKKLANVERRVQSCLQKELLAASIARLKGRSGRDAWSEVRQWQKFADFWSGLIDALCGRHKLYDVVEAYRGSLQDTVNLSKLRQEAADGLQRWTRYGFDRDVTSDDMGIKKHREDGSKITEQDRLLARIAVLQAQIALIETTVDTLSDTTTGDYEAAIDEEEAENRPFYDRWHRYLQRPAYFERVSADVRAEAEASAVARRAVGSDEAHDRKVPSLETTVGFFGRLTNAFKNAAGAGTQNAINVAMPLLIPVEAYFTFPAFEVLTPDNFGAALAGCLTFTGALAGTGMISAYCYRRIFRHTLVSDEAGNDTVVVHKSASWAVFLSIAFPVAMLLVIGGADLRAKIPVMSDWLDVQASLDARHLSLIDRIGTDPTNPRVQKEREDLEKAQIDHARAREGTLKFGSGALHSDAAIGLGIYAFLVLLGALKVLMSTDPYFEYHLLSISMRVNRENRLRIAASRDYAEHWRKALMYRCSEKLNALRVQLWLAAPSDPLALAPMDDPADTATVDRHAATTADDSADTEPAPDMDTDVSFGAIWVRMRLRNYIRSYTLLRGKALAAKWPESLRKAMS